MADIEQVSSTTPNEEEPKLLHESGMGDVKELSNEAVAKDSVKDDISDLAVAAEDEEELPAAPTSDKVNGLSEPEPEPEAPALVTSTIGDATEQLTEETLIEPDVHKDEEPVVTEETVAEEPEPAAEPVVEPALAAPRLEAEETVQETPVEEPAVEPVLPAPAVEHGEIVEEIPVEAPPPPPAPAPSYEPTPAPSAPSQPLMQFPSVVELLYWRNVKNSGVVFGASLLLLLSLTICSIITVFSYLALALLSITIAFRIYKGVLQAIQKSDEGHPFKHYLDQDVALSEELVHKYSDLALARINASAKELRRLFLVEDLVDSLKFAVVMWILTYVGAFFNGLTLLILGLISAFVGPIVYEKHQTQIDQYLGLVNNQIKDIVGKIQAKVPGMKKKAE